jgi:hypothetical protein
MSQAGEKQNGGSSDYRDADAYINAEWDAG